MIPCAWCGWVAPLVWVHGHGQCAHCGTVTEECCRGEQAEAPAHLDADTAARPGAASDRRPDR